MFIQSKKTHSTIYNNFSITKALSYHIVWKYAETNFPQHNKNNPREIFPENLCERWEFAVEALEREELRENTFHIKSSILLLLFHSQKHLKIFLTMLFILLKNWKWNKIKLFIFGKYVYLCYFVSFSFFCLAYRCMLGFLWDYTVSIFSTEEENNTWYRFRKCIIFSKFCRFKIEYLKIRIIISITVCFGGFYRSSLNFLLFCDITFKFWGWDLVEWRDFLVFYFIDWHLLLEISLVSLWMVYILFRTRDREKKTRHYSNITWINNRLED